LASTNKPAIVIASSGMCTGGRIVNYLTKMMENPVHQIMFCGYQARGTPGAAIIKAARSADKTVWLQGRAYQLQAEVLVLGGFSAHADQQDLIRFIQGMRQRPSEIRLVHGDTAAKLALQRQLTERGYFVSIPRTHTE
jgi:metallo-beta-lactamase family protein